MILLKANTAVDVLIGPFVDDTDGKTAETGLTIDVELSKNGQALTDSESGAPTHDAAGTVDGYYNCVLGTTDTNTEGALVLVAHAAGFLPVRHEMMVMAEAAYDSFFAAKDTGFMDVNIKAVSEDTTAADNAEAFFDGTGYAGTNNVIPTVTTLTGHTAQTGDSFAIVNGAHGLVSIQDDIDAVLVDTNELQVDWANGGRLDLILDIIAADTTTDIPALIATAQADLDIITGATGVNLLAATQASIDAIETDTGTTLDTLIKDIPTTAEFELRTLLAADYTVVGDLGTVQSGDSFAIVNGDHGLVSIQDDVDAILIDTSATLPTAAECATAVWSASNSTLTKAYSLIMEQIYQFLHNDMNITDATGAVALRNLANDADMATWGITDNDTTTARTDVVWA